MNVKSLFMKIAQNALIQRAAKAILSDLLASTAAEVERLKSTVNAQHVVIKKANAPVLARNTWREDLKGVRIKVATPEGYISGVVYFGPYAKKPARLPGVCLAPELSHLESEHVINIPDYGVPNVQDKNEGLKAILRVLKEHKAVYIGCWGGIGRTGLVLGLLYRLAEDTHPKTDPVEWVRAVHVAHAIETSAQESFVRETSLDAIVNGI